MKYKINQDLQIKAGYHTGFYFSCAPGMGDSLAVKVRYGLGSGNH